MLEAVSRGAEAGATGVLVDEQFGSNIPEHAREHRLKLALPVEKSGQNEFDFQYGESFGAHIEKFNPDFAKVLVRYNSDDPDTEMNQRQLARLKELAAWLHTHDRKFLFELLVPATDEQLVSVDGDTDRYDAELRPDLMRRAIEDTQKAGIEVDVWKIDGVDAQSDAKMLAEQARSDEDRDGVTCVLLGRGASTEKVEQWLREAAPVDGFIGFAIGRSIWWDALKGFLDDKLERSAAASQIADNYLHFVTPARASRSPSHDHDRARDPVEAPEGTAARCAPPCPHWRSRSRRTKVSQRATHRRTPRRSAARSSRG
jgi:myo-inositol catabolism protein IolC